MPTATNSMGGMAPQMNNMGGGSMTPQMGAGTGTTAPGAAAAEDQSAWVMCQQGRTMGVPRPTVASRAIPVRSTLDAFKQARIAYMRFGLGPKPTTPGFHWTVKEKAYGWLKGELKPVNANVTYRPMNARVLPDNTINADYNLYGVPTPRESFINGNGFVKTSAWPQADLRAMHRKKLQSTFGILERLVMFWSNHFSIYSGKDFITMNATGLVERNAIRPHVLGKYPDMLKAVLQQPAMISYLDNGVNVGPDSYFWGGGPETAQHRKLNENLARETLELYTVGKYANYSQCDVRQLACLLTGFKVNGTTGEGIWSAEFAQPGTFTLLNNVYPQTFRPGFSYTFDPLNKPTGYQKYLFEQARYQATKDQALRAIHDLAVNEFTAKNLAAKMFTHFIGGPAPDAAIETLATAFGPTGDLMAMTKALLDLPEAWEYNFANEDGRITTPQIALGVMNRVIGLTEDQINALSGKKWGTDESPFAEYLSYLNQTIWAHFSPDGYSDDPGYWFDGAAMRVRRDATYVYLKKVAERLDTSKDGMTYSLPDAAALARLYNRLGFLSDNSRDLVINTQVLNKDNRPCSARDTAAARLTLLFMTTEFLRR